MDWSPLHASLWRADAWRRLQLPHVFVSCHLLCHSHHSGSNNRATSSECLGRCRLLHRNSWMLASVCKSYMSNRQQPALGGAGRRVFLVDRHTLWKQPQKGGWPALQSGWRSNAEPACTDCCGTNGYSIVCTNTSALSLAAAACIDPIVARLPIKTDGGTAVIVLRAAQWSRPECNRRGSDEFSHS